MLINITYHSMTIKLYHIDSGEVRHMYDIVQSVKIIYQMEAEFAPYLHVIFIPRAEGQREGIILQTNTEIIRKNYTFKDKNEINELRNLILTHLLKEHPNITTDDCQMAKVNFNVIEGWQNKKRMLKSFNCCKIIPTQPKLQEHAYKLRANDLRLYGGEMKQDKQTCNLIRKQICDQSYPVNSYQHDYCLWEANNNCNLEYDTDLNDNVNNYINDTQKLLYEQLRKNNGKVDKKLFDDIIMAGMFDNLHIHNGNNRECFSESNNNIYSPNSINYTKYILFTLCIFLITLCIFVTR